MALACLFVDDSAVTADLHGLSAVTLVGRHEFDPAVAVFGTYQGSCPLGVLS
jgi:hypothetical protein